MRILSILCGLAFAGMAGFLLACSSVANPSLGAIDRAVLGQIFAPISWVALALALLGGALAWHSRCEGWGFLTTGCAVFLLCQLALALATGLAGSTTPALLCLIAAGCALMPLVRMPNSYWRVAG